MHCHPQSFCPSALLDFHATHSSLPVSYTLSCCIHSQLLTIPVIVTDRSRPRTLHPFCTSTHDSGRPPTDKCRTAYGISFSNLIKIDTGPFIQEFSKHFKVMFLNVSVRNKALDICDYIMQANVDLVFMCETWLRPVGDEADCAALTPPGFCLKSLPR